MCAHVIDWKYEAAFGAKIGTRTSQILFGIHTPYNVLSVVVGPSLDTPSIMNQSNSDFDSSGRLSTVDVMMLTKPSVSSSKVRFTNAAIFL